jgi:hypothetical protein
VRLLFTGTCLNRLSVWQNSLDRGSANRQVLYQSKPKGNKHETRAYITVLSGARNRYPSVHAVKTVHASKGTAECDRHDNHVLLIKTALETQRLLRYMCVCIGVHHGIPDFYDYFIFFSFPFWAWGGVVVKGLRLLVGRSRDRSPVESLGIFSVASDNSMYPGSTQPLKMSTRIFLGVKTAGAYG